MDVVILCGGKSSRLKSASEDIPKPLALVNGKPLIWHIMRIYSSYGYNEFILPLGYKGEKIKEYFVNYSWMSHDFVLDCKQKDIILLQEPEAWKIKFIDTGIDTMTGGRIKRIEKYINGDTFMLTYGDGLSDIDINALVQYHQAKGKIATVTGIQRKSQFGILTEENGITKSFEEKSKLEGLVNGGFFVLNKKVFDYIEDHDHCVFEQEPLKKLTRESELAVYMHSGLWISVDTYKDLMTANDIWNTL